MVCIPVVFAGSAVGPKGFDQVRINCTSRQELLADIESRLGARYGFTLATLNLDHIVKLGRDAAFRDAYAQHSHIVADGNPVVWLSRLARRKVDLMPGAELIRPLAKVAARKGVRIALLGTTPEVLDRVADQLSSDIPGLEVAARIAPPMGVDPLADAHAIATLRGSGAGLCFVALGAPKQEIFAAGAARLLPHCGFVSVGAGLDFIAGAQRRAPRWVRRIAMEWFWRLAFSPRRLGRRYWDCALILPGLAMQSIGQRARNVRGPG